MYFIVEEVFDEATNKSTYTIVNNVRYDTLEEANTERDNIINNLKGKDKGSNCLAYKVSKIVDELDIFLAFSN